MKTAIPCLYSSYGRYIDEFRAIPSIEDCLKVVERRVLYAMHKSAKKLTKSAKIVGDCIGMYHPHGDASTYDTLVNLVNRGFGIGQGNFGFNGLKPTPAAQYRYTEAKIEPLVEKIAFDLIKYVPYNDPEALDTLQPTYIPSCIPIGLVGDGVITGISFNTTKIPRYTFYDLICRLQNIFQRQVDPSVPLKTIVPNIPNFDVYEATEGDFERILTTGEGKIILRPKYSVDKYGVHVYGRPPLGCSGWLKEDSDSKKILYSCDDLSSKRGFEALFSPKNGARLDQNFVNMILSIVESSITFQCNVWDGTKVRLTSIDELLLHSYDNWTSCLHMKWDEEAQGIRQIIREMIVIELIRNMINTYNVKLNKISDLLDTYTNHYLPQHPQLDITIDEIKAVCKKHTIHRLFDYHIDKAANDKALKAVEDRLNNFAVEAFKVVIGFLS